jgi:DNA-binding NarL/FixJ family response regulator
MMRLIRVAVADDHPIVLDGLRFRLSAEPGIEIVGIAQTGSAALDCIRSTAPDVAILDISLPDLNGIVLTRRILGAHPNVRVLLLTSHDDRATVTQAIEAGASGYLLKRSIISNLVPAVRAVFTGGLFLDPAIVEHVLRPAGARAGRSETAVGTKLTDREEAVLRLVARGLSNKEIARNLAVSVKTVETYRSRGFARIGVKSRADLVRYGAAEGWLTGL